MLTDINSQVDRTHQKMVKVDNKLKELIAKSNQCCLWVIVIVEIVVLILLLVLWSFNMLMLINHQKGFLVRVGEFLLSMPSIIFLFSMYSWDAMAGPFVLPSSICLWSKLWCAFIYRSISAFRRLSSSRYTRTSSLMYWASMVSYIFVKLVFAFLSWIWRSRYFLVSISFDLRSFLFCSSSLTK